MEDDGHCLVDPAVALGQGLLCPLGYFRHCLTPYPPGGCLETRRTRLFPRNLFYCYHCFALSSTKGRLRPGRSVLPTPSGRIVFSHDSALFCARPCGVFALSPLPLGAVSGIVSCPAPSSCSNIKYIMNINGCQYQRYHKYRRLCKK